MNARFFETQSFSDPSAKHIVRQTAEGEWRCDCPGFVLGKKKCDHIRKVRHQRMKNHGRTS